MESPSKASDLALRKCCQHLGAADRVAAVEEMARWYGRSRLGQAGPIHSFTQQTQCDAPVGFVLGSSDLGTWVPCSMVIETRLEEVQRDHLTHPGC